GRAIKKREAMKTSDTPARTRKTRPSIFMALGYYKREPVAALGSFCAILRNMDLKNIPASPGVYLMRDDIGRILYVGKAQNLSQRVGSYFADNGPASSKTGVLVSSVHHIDYIPAASEREALLVERSLIRQLQPHYNTVWRD